MVSSVLLVHEQQLGEALNHSVHAERRADFSLMLAMLADDAREFSQFKQPEKQETIIQTTDGELRSQFDLPEPQALALKNIAQLHQYNQAQLIDSSGSLSQVKLEDALNNKPLAFRNDPQHLPTEVKANTSLYCQQKVEQEKDVLTEKLSSNVNEWLKHMAAIKQKQQIYAAA